MIIIVVVTYLHLPYSIQMSKVSNNPSTFYVDADDEWRLWNRMGDPVLHVELRDWADALVIAPLSAHSLAKLAHGLCDDTLSCVVRAWDFGHGKRPAKPMILVPAMNTAMWEHPLTRSQLETIQGFAAKKKDHNHLHDYDTEVGGGVIVVSPQVKTLVCGEIGNGAMAAADDILRIVHDAMQSLSS
jgi:phosphopantothenoylcysteine decarboxylase